MTPTEALEHQEKMEAARGEFALWWAKYWKHGLPIVRTQHELTAWEAWKAAKGLAK